jgi:GNAT superfamily N-acetyltransferase
VRALQSPIPRGQNVFTWWGKYPTVSPPGQPGGGGGAASAGAVSIRRADPSEAEGLTSLAHAAKRHWGYPEAWIAQWRRVLTVSAQDVERLQVFVVAQAEQLLGFYALDCAGALASLEHLWVLPTHLGQGLGAALLRHAMLRARQLGARAIEIESDPDAEGFYRRLGAERVGQVPAPMEGQPDRVLPLLRLALEDEETAA